MNRCDFAWLLQKAFVFTLAEAFLQTMTMGDGYLGSKMPFGVRLGLIFHTIVSPKRKVSDRIRTE